MKAAEARDKALSELEGAAANQHWALHHALYLATRAQVYATLAVSLEVEAQREAWERPPPPVAGWSYPPGAKSIPVEYEDES